MTVTMTAECNAVFVPNYYTVYLKPVFGTSSWKRLCERVIEPEVSDRWSGYNVRQHGALFRWPSRSPELTSCIFFLWGFIKDHIHDRELPINLPQLRHGIKEAIAYVNPDLLTKMCKELEITQEVCLIIDGAYNEHLWKARLVFFQV